MTRIARSGLPAAMAALVLLPAAVLAGNVTKFTFAPVTFPDGTTGVIEASSKTTNKSTVTVCEYYTDGHVTYLGQFQSSTFASTDPAAVEQFCLANYANRVQ